MKWPTSKPNPELEALLKRAIEIENAKTPLQRAIGHMQSKRSYVAAETF